jgi:hypothetical protein
VTEREAPGLTAQYRALSWSGRPPILLQHTFEVGKSPETRSDSRCLRCASFSPIGGPIGAVAGAVIPGGMGTIVMPAPRRNRRRSANRREIANSPMDLTRDNGRGAALIAGGLLRTPGLRESSRNSTIVCGRRMR